MQLMAMVINEGITLVNGREEAGATKRVTVRIMQMHKLCISNPTIHPTTIPHSQW
jgi:hypothetical protein